MLVVVLAVTEELEHLLQYPAQQQLMLVAVVEEDKAAALEDPEDQVVAVLAE
jgi:hypothetical protein